MPPRASSDSSPTVLVLWDVDHTLIETRGVGFAVYQRAFRAATGTTLRELAQVAGRTELDIMTETLRINGIEPTGQAVARLGRELIAGYEAARTELATKGRALPGAKQTLAQLANDAAVYQSVLTGNLKDVARIKVEVFDLAEHLDLAAGAYGEDDHDRARLVHLAQQRATSRTGVTFPNQRTVLIGDTPNDIRAALDADVHAVAVATGKSTEDDLRQAGAHTVIRDLQDAALVRRAIADLTG